MRRRGRDAAHFLLLVLLVAFLLVAGDTAVFFALSAPWKDDFPIGAQAIEAGLIYENGSYELSADAKKQLRHGELFAMLLDENGEILWEEALPEELRHSYTLRDVAIFTRYYLDDYPVHTYVIPEGLLIIGAQKGTVWKYTLEYNTELVRRFIRQIPLLALANLILLIAVPLFIQKKWLRRREAERTEWIAGVSHDIRTPLTLIVGNADRLRKESDRVSVAEKAGVIEEQALRIRALVANLNTSSRLDFGIAAYARTEIRVGAILRKTVSEIINRTPGQTYPIQLEIDDALQAVTVRANEDLFTRVIENLVNNSISHNPGGCRIEIRLEPGGRPFSPYVLKITDDGAGAATETLRALNRRHFSDLAGDGEHGIGLRVVRQIAGYHGWRVEFRNHPPHGFESLLFMRRF